MGLLLAQYTITGFDASAHVSEETVGANVSAPKAIVRAIYVSAIAALLLNVALTQALPKAANGGIDADAYTAIAFGGSGDTLPRERRAEAPRHGARRRRRRSCSCSSRSWRSTSAAWRRSRPTAA